MSHASTTCFDERLYTSRYNLLILLQSLREFPTTLIEIIVLYSYESQIIVVNCGVLGKPSYLLNIDDQSFSTANIPDLPIRYGYYKSICKIPTNNHNHNHNYYVISGSENENSLQRYDVHTRIWKSLNFSMKYRMLSSIVVVGQQIYMIGGTTSCCSITSLNSLYIYDIQTDNWSIGTPMKRARHHTSSIVIGSCIYVIGGVVCSFGNYIGSTSVVDIEMFNTITNEWTTLANMPIMRSRAILILVHGKIWVFGGLACGLGCLQVDVYDPIRDIWTTRHDWKLSEQHVESLIRLGYFNPVSNEIILIMNKRMDSCFKLMICKRSIFGDDNALWKSEVLPISIDDDYILSC
jgi:hypothetical protein